MNNLITIILNKPRKVGKPEDCRGLYWPIGLGLCSIRIKEPLTISEQETELCSWFRKTSWKDIAGRCGCPVGRVV